MCQYTYFVFLTQQVETDTFALSNPGRGGLAAGRVDRDELTACGFSNRDLSPRSDWTPPDPDTSRLGKNAMISQGFPGCLAFSHYFSAVSCESVQMLSLHPLEEQAT